MKTKMQVKITTLILTLAGLLTLSACGGSGGGSGSPTRIEHNSIASSTKPAPTHMKLGYSELMIEVKNTEGMNKLFDSKADAYLQNGIVTTSESSLHPNQLYCAHLAKFKSRTFGANEIVFLTKVMIQSQGSLTLGDDSGALLGCQRSDLKPWTAGDLQSALGNLATVSTIDAIQLETEELENALSTSEPIEMEVHKASVLNRMFESNKTYFIQNGKLIDNVILVDQDQSSCVSAPEYGMRTFSEGEHVSFPNILIEGEIYSFGITNPLFLIGCRKGTKVKVWTLKELQSVFGDTATIRTKTN